MIEFLLIWLTRICTGVIVRRKSDDCMTPGGGSMRTTQVILIGWPFSASFRAGCGGAFVRWRHSTIGEHTQCVVTLRFGSCMRS